MESCKLKRVDLRYLLAFLVVFVIEVLIAMFVRDTIIRPFVGDILVVVLIYLFIKIFFIKPIRFLSLYIFTFALTIEILQYFNLVELLNLQDCKILAIALGSTFDLHDILCYLIGAVVVAVWELYISKRANTPLGKNR